MAFGSIAHYLKRVEEFHESRKTGEPLPPRWLHLAERSLRHRPILTYSEYFSTGESQPKLDSLTHEINMLLEQEEIQTEKLAALYSEVRQTLSLSESQSSSPL